MTTRYFITRLLIFIAILFAGFYMGYLAGRADSAPVAQWETAK